MPRRTTNRGDSILSNDRTTATEPPLPEGNGPAPILDTSPGRVPGLPVRRKLVVAVLLVAAADALFLRHAAGWSAGLFAVLVVVALLLTHGGTWRRRPAAWTLLYAVLAAGALVVEPTPLAYLPAGLSVTTLALVLRHGGLRTVSGWVMRFTAFGLLWPFAGLFDLGRLARARRRQFIAAAPEATLAARGTAFGRWLLPALLGFVFLLLFAAANPLIARGLGDISQLADWLGGQLDLGRLLFWLVVGSAMWALLRLRTPPVATDASAGLSPLPDIMAPATIVRCLVVFNALFLMQNVLDLRYLVLGEALPDGMTYAEYAHRGSYPLVACALLAAGFVLVGFRSGQAAPELRTARRLVLVWLAQTVVLTFAAVWRLELYVSAFSLTQLRLAAALWMLLVIAGLVLIGWRIWRGRSNRWLIAANVVAVLGMALACCFMDTRRFIADFNVEHCAEIGDGEQALDFDYLTTLGVSALPALSRLERELPRTAVGLRTRAGVLASLQRAQLERQVASWRTWTWRRQHLLDASR